MFTRKKDKSLRVLILTHTYSDRELGGEPKIVYETSKALSNHGVDVYVVASRVNINQPVNNENLKVYQAPFCRQVSIFNQSNMLMVFLFSLPLIFFKRIDLIHLMAEPGPCPFVRFKIRPLVFSSDVPWDYGNEKYGQELKYDRKKKSEEKNLPISRNFLEKIFDKLADCFYTFFELKDEYPNDVDLYACTSMKLINILRSKRYSSDFSLIQWGVNPKIFNPNVKPFKSRKDYFTFMFIGTLSKRKGIEYLINSFSKLRERYDNIELVLIGDGALSTIVYFKRIASGSRINFVGPIMPADIPKYLVYTDVFVLPSLGEPFGLVNLEAMACGKPVISTNAGGVPDYFKDKEIGFLVEPANINELEKAMEKFLLDPSLAKKLGEQAQKYVVNNLTWDHTAQKMINAYQTLLNYDD